VPPISEKRPHQLLPPFAPIFWFAQHIFDKSTPVTPSTSKVVCIGTNPSPSSQTSFMDDPLLYCRSIELLCTTLDADVRIRGWGKPHVDESEQGEGYESRYCLPTSFMDNPLGHPKMEVASMRTRGRVILYVSTCVYAMQSLK